MIFLGCPKILRTDPGTENSIVVQPALRHNASDSFAGSNSHCYGKSPSNQVTDDHLMYGCTQ